MVRQVPNRLCLDRSHKAFRSCRSRSSFSFSPLSTRLGKGRFLSHIPQSVLTFSIERSEWVREVGPACQSIFLVINWLPCEAWAVATCFFWSAVLSLTFPSLLRDAGPVGAFGFYVSFVTAFQRQQLTPVPSQAGLNAVAFFMIYCAVPESTLRSTVRDQPS